MSRLKLLNQINQGVKVRKRFVAKQPVAFIMKTSERFHRILVASTPHVVLARPTWWPTQKNHIYKRCYNPEHNNDVLVFVNN